MIKVMFVCLGNVCRSPMAELVFKNMLDKKFLEHEIQVASSGTNNFNVGSPVHPGTRRKLNSVGISSDAKKSQQYLKSHYEAFDYIVCMDQSNVKDATRISGGDPENKINLLLDYTNESRGIADPYYTNDFDLTYEDVVAGCQGLLDHIISCKNDPIGVR